MSSHVKDTEVKCKCRFELQIIIFEDMYDEIIVNSVVIPKVEKCNNRVSKKRLKLLRLQHSHEKNRFEGRFDIFLEISRPKQHRDNKYLSDSP